MKPRLISFKLCPYAQRVALVLARKRVDHDIEYIDLSDPPDWFVRISPLKKVPVLTLADHALFESTAISEFIDEMYPHRLHPEDAFVRAMNRSWINFSNECMLDLGQMILRKSEHEFHVSRDALLKKFDQLEPAVRATPFFNGADFSLVDCSYAPLFQRLDLIEGLNQKIYDRARHANIVAWKERLLSEDCMRFATPMGMSRSFYDFLRSQQSYLSRFAGIDTMVD
jgi:glutathione S-transferase